VFGVDKIFKNTVLDESMIQASEGALAGKVLRLVAELRAGKPYQYAPLFIAVCGSGSVA